MADVRGVIVAIVFFVMVVAVIIPLVPPAPDTTVQGNNEGSAYLMESRSIYETTVIAVEDGAATIDGLPVTGLGLAGTVMVMSDVLTMAIDAETGSYSAWTILLESQGCAANSDDDATLVYTFQNGHLTITDSEDDAFAASSWFRYLLVPAAEGDIGVWSAEDMAGLTINKAAMLYVSYGSGSDSGTVYGTPGNIAAGQNIASGARAYGSASAIYDNVLDGSAVHVTGFDSDGGIVGDGAYVATGTIYSYSDETQTDKAASLLMAMVPILCLIAVIAIIIKVIR